MVEGAHREQGLHWGCGSCFVGAVGMRLLVLARMGKGGLNQMCRSTIPVWE